MNISFRYLIEIVRGLAACLVVYQHTSNYSETTMSEYFDFGKLGVILFFMISGYLIPSSIARNGVPGFIVGRFFRLYPLYWLSIGLWLIFVSGADFRLILANLTMFQQYLGYENLISVYWTLTIELFFYGLSCVLFLVFKKNLIKSARVGIAMATFLTAILLLLKCVGYNGAPLALGLGLVLMYVSSLHKEEPLSKFVYFSVLIFVTIVTYIGYYDEAVEGGFSKLRYPLTYIVAIAIVALLVKMPFKIQRTNKLAELGAAAYGIYLFHMIIFYLFFDTKGFFPFAITIIVTICLSFAIHKFIEVPSIKFSKKLSMFS